MIPDDLKYTEEHEWVRLEGDEATVGITHFAQDQLGDIVDIDLPEAGRVVKHMQECGSIESVKTASDLFSPLSGEILARNEALLSRIDGKKNADFHPEWVNEEPYGKGWFFRIRLSDPSEVGGLLDAAGYQGHVG